MTADGRSEPSQSSGGGCRPRGLAHSHKTPMMALPAKPLQHGRQRGGVVGKIDLLPTGGLPANFGEAESCARGTDALGRRRQLCHLRPAVDTIERELEAGGAGVDGQNPWAVRNPAARNAPIVPPECPFAGSHAL